LDNRDERELTIRDLAVIYRRRRKVIYITLATAVLLVGLYCIFSTRRYEATGTVQIQKESSDGLGLDSMISGAADSASDALDANIIIATQASILTSDTLALRTIKDLNLEGTEDFRPHWNPLNWVMALFSPAGIKDPANVSIDQAPERRRRALKVFSDNLTVKPVSGTRLIEIDYLNPDPKLAAAVVNELTQALVDYTFQTRFNATNQASDWLRGQLGDLRQQSEDLQKQVVDLQSQSGVYSLGTVDATGKELAYSGVLDQLQEATSALAAAKQSRILRGAIAQAAQSGDAEMLSGLAGNAVVGSPVSNSLLLIQNLRQQQATEAAALREAEAKYGSGHPKLDEIRANLTGIQTSIHEEIGRLRDRAQNDFAIAQQTEDATRKDYDRAKIAADKLNDKAIEFAIVRQEAEESRQLYEGLLTKLKEAGILEGLKSSNITVVDPGRTPSKPKKPNIPVYMALSVVGGFFLGCCGALLIETMDNKINTISDAEEIVGQNILGATPQFDLKASLLLQAGATGGAPLTSLDEPHSTFTESLRGIRTAIMLTASEQKSRVIMVTSSIPAEGKTLLSSNLAVILAQSNSKVLLVDMDLRRGTIRRRLGLQRSIGLSELLAGQVAKPEIRPFERVANLDILQAGAAPPNPSELLSLRSFADWLAVWRSQYDVIVLDSAPLLPVTDSLIVNPLVDITLLIARCRVTERPQLKRSYSLITQTGHHFCGIILNGLRPSDESYYGYYGYRKYAYKYGNEEN
jgi:succinoglycan biosynthesis transport protein ExoP